MAHRIATGFEGEVAEQPPAPVPRRNREVLIAASAVATWQDSEQTPGARFRGHAKGNDIGPVDWTPYREME
jgi:hypothetical protein